VAKAPLLPASFVRAEALTHKPRIAADCVTQRWQLVHELCLCVAASAATFESLKNGGFSH
jgi:hypothetical protein